MATDGGRPVTPPADEQRQEKEFYEALTALLASMPRGTTVPDALATDAGQRIWMKWRLKYRRQPPL